MGAFGGTITALNGSGISQTQAIQAWQTAVGRTDTCYKAYYGAGIYPSTIDGSLAAAHSLGIRVYICVQPPSPPTSAAASAMRSAFLKLQALGLNFAIVPYQEVEDKLSAAAAITAFQFYYPHLADIAPVVLDHAGHAGPAKWAAYDPGPASYDVVAVDFYGNSYAGGVRLDGILAQAHAGSKPWGVFELGNYIRNTTPPTQAQVTAYINYITGLAAADRAANLPLDAFMWYQNPNLNPGNVISSSADFRVPLLDALADAVTAAGPSPGFPASAEFVAAAEAQSVLVVPIVPPLAGSPAASFLTDLPGDIGTLQGPGGPVPGNGWELVVLSHADYTTPLVVVPDFTSQQFAKVLKDKGSGSVVLNQDDPLLFPPGQQSLNAQPFFEGGDLSGWSGQGATIGAVHVADIGAYSVVAVSGSDSGTSAEASTVQIFTPGSSTASSDTGLFTEHGQVIRLGQAQFGATVNPATYGLSSYVNAAAKFNSLTSLTWAGTTARWVFTEGTLPTTVPQGILGLASLGCLIYIVFAPSRAQSSSQKTALANCIASLQAANVNFRAILWPRPNGSGFASAAAYASYVAYYGPVVKQANVRLVYNPDGSDTTGAVAYYPGDSFSFEVAPDYSAYAYVSGARLAPMFALADNHLPSPSPAGIIAVSGGEAASVPTPAQWSSYVHYLIQQFQLRGSAGLHNSVLVYDATFPNTAITSSSDYEVAGLQLMDSVL